MVGGRACHGRSRGAAPSAVITPPTARTAAPYGWCASSLVTEAWRRRIKRRRSSHGCAAWAQTTCASLCSITARDRALRLRRKLEVRRLRLGPLHRHGGILRSVLLVPRLDGVGPGRQAGDREAALAAGRREERMR